MSTQAQDLTVRKSVSVSCSPPEAFELFTERLGTWWPFETHRPGDEMPEAAVFEGREGGRVYHRVPSGKEEEWATVLVWDPPARFVIDWHVNPENPSKRYGEQAGESFASYDTGWNTVLGRYVEKAG
jgi:hypothetical protein